MPKKDRSYTRILATDAQIIVQRSTAHPFAYSLTLVVYRDGSWHPVRCYDNAHHVDEHHEHRYIGHAKQPPIVTGGTPEDGMGEAQAKLLKGWRQMVDAWERTR